MPSPSFKIIVEQDTITMHGTPQECAGNVLRGQLVLEVSEPTKIKSIKLSFQGKSKITWPGDSTTRVQNEEKVLFEHDWVFLHPKKYHILEPGNYQWGFELILPGSLPETVEGCEHGSIQYRLKAVAERHSFALNLSTQKKITLHRCSFLNTEDALDTVVANTWANRVIYDISVDLKTFTLGDEISLSVNLELLGRDLRIHEYKCAFNECVTYTVGSNKRSSAKTLKSVRGVDFHRDGGIWSDSLKLRIPNTCLYDSNNHIIQISHQLKLSIIFITDDNRFIELRATLPVTVTLNTDDMELPPYREYIPYKTYSCDIYDNLENINFSLPSYDSVISNTPASSMDLSAPPIYVM